MFTITLSQVVDRAFSVFVRLGQRFSDLLAGIEEARVLAHRFKTLSQLTDAQLAARGLRREDIPQAVLNLSIHA